jgi:hypothetical protein
LIHQIFSIEFLFYIYLRKPFLRTHRNEIRNDCFINTFILILKCFLWCIQKKLYLNFIQNLFNISLRVLSTKVANIKLRQRCVGMSHNGNWCHIVVMSFLTTSHLWKCSFWIIIKKKKKNFNLLSSFCLAQHLFLWIYKILKVNIICE